MVSFVYEEPQEITSQNVKQMVIFFMNSNELSKGKDEIYLFCTGNK
jgi:hypothetical protein